MPNDFDAGRNCVYKLGKTQAKPTNCLRQDWFYDAARIAMEDFLFQVTQSDYANSAAAPLRVLIPAYIGVSPKEGSGIYDPLISLRDRGLIEFEFYRMTSNLFIDVVDAFDLIVRHRGNPFVFLKVNYFGFSDPCEIALYDAVKNSGGLLLEDNAHGYFTFQERSKHYCDATFFSLHKQFPFSRGGMLHVCGDSMADWSFAGSTFPNWEENPFRYDSGAISLARRRNYERLDELMHCHEELWFPLRTLRGIPYTVPQTYPIALRHCDRFRVYEEINEQGYGVTSLYHTLIEPLRNDPSFAESQRLSACILNIPVHQDVDEFVYPDLVEALAESCVKNHRDPSLA